MAEMNFLQLAIHAAFFVISVASAVMVAAIVVGLIATVCVWAAERVFCAAALVEAAHEARRQGRAPILKAWLKIPRWWRND